MSAGVSRMTAAIILMGSPRNVPGRVGNAGNATEGGVRKHCHTYLYRLTVNISLPPVPWGTNALRGTASFAHTATRPTCIALKGIVAQHIRAMVRSMAKTLSIS